LNDLKYLLALLNLKKLIKMKNKTTFFNGLAFIFLVFLLFNSCSQGPIDATNEIEEANKGFMEAFNSGDANALAMKYTTMQNCILQTVM